MSLLNSEDWVFILSLFLYILLVVWTKYTREMIIVDIKNSSSPVETDELLEYLYALKTNILYQLIDDDGEEYILFIKNDYFS